MSSFWFSLQIVSGCAGVTCGRRGEDIGECGDSVVPPGGRGDPEPRITVVSHLAPSPGLLPGVHYCTAHIVAGLDNTLAGFNTS